MSPRHFVIGVLLAACGGGSGMSADAGAARTCSDDLDCEFGDVCNADGECESFCKDVPGGHACNYGFASDWPPTCCTADEICCEVGFEHEECMDSGAGCPILCFGDVGYGSDYFTCPSGSRCLVPATAPPDAGVADAGSRDAGPAAPDAGPPTCLPASDCATSCPPSQQCGQSCCPPGTTCNGYCCVE